MTWWLVILICLGCLAYVGMGAMTAYGLDATWEFDSLAWMFGIFWPVVWMFFAVICVSLWLKERKRIT